ncbi:MAG: rod shape-determining protein [Magnetococcales bacterium]|nr:rod shape-determining protein [Magnetococcales bacterium]MBF0435460.1 rod shape-determining protein [Magnetococcales bacterium]
MESSAQQGRNLFLGIDLGTSRTTVVSNRGTKEAVRSVVGYPKDIIGVKLLDQTNVVGEEALDRRSYLNIHFPLEDGVLKEASEKDTQAAKELIQYAISLAHPQPGDRVCGIVGVPARASISNKNQLLRITNELMHFSMVVSEPFMVAYGLNKLTNAIIIDIGAGTIDICAMRGTIPGAEEQVTLMKAGNHVDNFLTSLISESYPNVQITTLLAQKIKDQFGFVGQPEQDIIVNLRANGKPQPHEITREVRMACEAIVPDIIENVQQLITIFDPENQEEVVGNIILAGGGSRMRGLDRILADSLREYGDVRIHLVDDPIYAGSLGALKMATELPLEYWNQVGDVIGG